MSFLGDFGRIATAVVTGGTSELVRLVSPQLATSFQQLVFPTNLQQVATTLGTVLPVSKLPLGVAASLLAPATNPTYSNLGSQYAAQGYVYDPTINAYTKPLPVVNTGAVVPPPAPQGGSMGLDLSGILGGISNIFGNNQNPIFQTVSTGFDLASSLTKRSTSVPGPISGPVFTTPAAGMAKSLGTVGRSFFNKFPNLATAIQMLRNQGRNVKRSQLYSMLKRFGPELLISGGILTAAAVSELMVAGPGRRRMNPGNVKALRRSMRRVESFHHLCQKADRLRRPRSRAKTVYRGGRTTEITRVG